MTQVTTTVERIKKAASKCPQAKKALETLFPEVFEEKINLHKRKGIEGLTPFEKNGDGLTCMIAFRAGALDRFWLSHKFNWKLVKLGGNEGWELIPTKKHKG